MTCFNFRNSLSFFCYLYNMIAIFCFYNIRINFSGSRFVTGIFKLNGKKVSGDAPVQTNLLMFLRETMNVTSPKFGCEQGNCGACTVLLDGEPVNSCLVLAPTVEGREVTTVEGLGTLQAPHPLQKAITEHYGAQCGYCTPGFVMTTRALLNENPTPTLAEVREALSGNLCRCGAYPRIRAAIHGAAHQQQGRGPGGERPPREGARRQGGADDGGLQKKAATDSLAA